MQRWKRLFFWKRPQKKGRHRAPKRVTGVVLPPRRMLPPGEPPLMPMYDPYATVTTELPVIERLREGTE